MGKKKDPLAPKKPLSSFFEFASKEREKILEELGVITIGEVGKELGRRWKILPMAEKEKFLKSSRESAKQYAVEMKQYVSQGGPKKPCNSYLEFVKVERSKVLEELGSLSIAEVGKELGMRWKILPEAQKVKFEEISKENMKLYVKELAEFSKQTILNSSSTSSSSQDFTPLPSSHLQAEIDEADPNLATAAAPEASFSVNLDTTPNRETAILASDLGFAKQRFYPWHPALKTGVMARGSRINVTYFGTAQG